MLKIICIFVLVTVVSCDMYCPPNACDNRQCDEVNCGPNERLKKNGTTCGCCPSCVTQLPKGEFCSILETPDNKYEQQECEQGTKCTRQAFTATCQ